MKKHKKYLVFILSITLSSLWAQQVIPDWVLNPASDDDYFYSIGISDLNGTVEQRKEQSLKRAIMQLSIIRECKVTSLDKNYITDDEETTEIVSQISATSIPDINDVEICRLWREEDGHVFTEIRMNKNYKTVSDNSLLIKYYYSEVCNESGTKDQTMSLQIYAKLRGSNLYESATQEKGGSFTYENIYVEYCPEFKQWFGLSAIPDWYLNTNSTESSLCSTGYGEHPNLHLAVLLATISSLKELSILMGNYTREIAAKFDNDNTQNLNEVLKTVESNTLKEVITRRISIGITENHNFRVYNWMSLPISK